MQSERQSSITTPKHRPEKSAPDRWPEYIVVTPAFNEKQNLTSTIDSMLGQEHCPRAWIVVDDGSSDGTWDVMAEAAERTNWIHAIRSTQKEKPNGDGLLAASEAAAFLEGLDHAVREFGDPEFVVKLDADLEFGPDYFTTLFEEFRANPNLGIAGGTVYDRKKGRLVKEPVSRDHVRGATKVYRWDCYRAIGGVRQLIGWDTVDELLAWEKGWDARSFNPPRLVHLRRTASRDGRFKGWVRNGRMVYFVGFSPWRILARVFYRIIICLDPVYGGGLLLGYAKEWFARKPRVDDAEILSVVRKYQWRNRLVRRRGMPTGAGSAKDRRGAERPL